MQRLDVLNFVLMREGEHVVFDEAAFQAVWGSIARRTLKDEGLCVDMWRVLRRPIARE